MPSQPAVRSVLRSRPTRGVSPTRGVTRALALGFAVLALLAAVAAPAAAHDGLTGTEPAVGSTVDVAPEIVRLTFSQEVVALGTEIQVIGPAGVPVGDGATVVLGAAVSQALLADRPAGPYTVRWRATSSDGHPTSGEFTFTSTAGVAPAAPPEAESPTPSASPAPTATPTAEPTSAEPTSGEPTSVEPTSGAVAGEAADGGSPWAIAAGAGVVVALGTAGVWWVRRQR